MLQEINEQSNYTYAGISNGLIVVKSNESDPKAKSRVNKLGTTVYERFYKSIYGIITSISLETNKFGEQQIRIGLKNKDMNGILTIKTESSYGRGFFAQIFNADLSKGIEFNPWQKVAEDGTKKSALYLGYGQRQNVDYKYPDGTPEVKWVDTKKGKVVDIASQIAHQEFLEDKLIFLIKEKGLTYTKTTSEEAFLPSGVDNTPLTEEEKKQLKKPTEKRVEKQAKAESEKDWDDFA